MLSEGPETARRVTFMGGTPACYNMPTSRETVLRPVGTSLGAIIPIQAVRESGIRPGERLHVRAGPGSVTLTRRLDDPAAKEALRLLKPFLGKSVRAVVLFGSYLTRRYRPGRSDIDLFIVVRKRTFELEKRIHRAFMRSPLPFSLAINGTSELGLISIMDEVRRGYVLYGTL